MQIFATFFFFTDFLFWHFIITSAFIYLDHPIFVLFARNLQIYFLRFWFVFFVKSFAVDFHSSFKRLKKDFCFISKNAFKTLRSKCTYIFFSQLFALNIPWISLFWLLLFVSVSLNSRFYSNSLLLLKTFDCGCLFIRRSIRFCVNVTLVLLAQQLNSYHFDFI